MKRKYSKPALKEIGNGVVEINVPMSVINSNPNRNHRIYPTIIKMERASRCDIMSANKVIYSKEVFDEYLKNRFQKNTIPITICYQADYFASLSKGIPVNEIKGFVDSIQEDYFIMRDDLQTSIKNHLSIFNNEEFVGAMAIVSNDIKCDPETGISTINKIDSIRYINIIRKKDSVYVDIDK